MFHKTLFLFLVLCLLALIPASLAQDFDNPSCSIETFTMSPSYGAVPQGTHIDLHGRGNCDGGVRAVRFEVHGIPKAEIGSNEQWETFKTEEFSLGTGLVCFAVAGGNNTSWLAAERRCYTVTIEAADSSSGGQTGQTGSPSGQNNVSSWSGELDRSGWCISIGYFGSANESYADTWYCYNENGSFGRSIDMSAVCAYSSGGSHPYAAYTDRNNPYSWYCSTSSQGNPSTNSGNPQSQPTQAPATSGGVNTGSCSFAPLSAGDRGRVTAGLANRVRTGPNTSYEYLTSIPEFTQFDVLSGPYAGNGYCWYEIQLDNGTVGYTAAGTYSDPWLEWAGEASSDGGYDLNPELPEISDVVIPYGLNTEDIEIVTTIVADYFGSATNPETWNFALNRVIDVMEPLADCGPIGPAVLQALINTQNAGYSVAPTREFVLVFAAQLLSELGADGGVSLFNCGNHVFNLGQVIGEEYVVTFANYIIQRLTE